jgi:hypothetical protein
MDNQAKQPNISPCSDERPSTSHIAEFDDFSRKQLDATKMEAELSTFCKDLGQQIHLAEGNAAQLDILRKTLDLEQFQSYRDNVNAYFKRKTNAKTWEDLQSNKFLRNLE